MRAILSFFKLLIFGIWSFLAIMIGGLLFIVRWKDGMAWVAKYFWSPIVIPLIGARIRTEGMDKIDPKQSYLIMGNHNSFIDIPVLFKTMPFYTYFIAKKELRKIPLLGWYIQAYGMIYIDRTDRLKAKESIVHAAKLVAKGKHIIIFPEGTKSKDGKIAPFKKGGFHLTELAQVPILPIKIEGARKIWPNKKPFKLGFGTIKVIVGDPIWPADLEEMSIADRAVYVREVISKL
ncbi:MAG: 1-acyl-sn-glycerol-3-phosphate acyltransferase [Crocinitomix sp.]|jgi:1-acyl-sn-glycerol-3-phosphate acyltransferase